VVKETAIRVIHAAVSKIGMDRDTYQGMLAAYGAKTSLALTDRQADELAKKLIAEAKSLGKWDDRNSSAKSDIPDRASSGQRAKIEVMWAAVSRAEPKDRRKALDRFLNNRFKIAKIEWLPQSMVGKVIRTLDAMRMQTEGEKEAANAGC
jgi:hypothetical protein